MPYKIAWGGDGKENSWNLKGVSKKSNIFSLREWGDTKL